MSTTDREILRAIDEFEALISGVVPRAFPPEITWKLLATAFLARFADQLRSMAILIEHHHYTDATVILRAIYESSVMFCWLAADPETRVGKWIEHTDRGRYQALREAKTDFLIEPPEMVDLNDLRAMERLEAKIQPRAREADAYWSDRLEAFRPVEKNQSGILTLTGMYTAVYRVLSRTAHAELDSIDPVVRPQGQQMLVSREARIKRRKEVLGIAIPIVGFSLIVYHHQFGGLDPKEVVRINHTMAGAIDELPDDMRKDLAGEGD